MTSQHRPLRWALPLLVVLILLAVPASAAPPLPPEGLGAGFTYQGELQKEAGPINDICDFQFRLWDAAVTGNQVAPAEGWLDQPAVQVTNGRFTVVLDFGPSAFDGNARWLEVGVRCPAGSGTYSLLGRQALTATPYARYAANVPWSGVVGAPPQLPTGCSAGQVAKWDNGSWSCQADAVGPSYNAGNGLALNDSTFNADLGVLQARVSGSCAVGSTIRSINADGTVACQSDAALNRNQPPARNAIATLDSAGDVGWFGSNTIGTDGLLIVAYYDNTNGDLKVAHCSDQLCSSATLAVLDSTGDVGFWPSITIGADGLPIISYYDSTNSDLKIAHCLDQRCSSADLATLDSAGTVGYDTWITLGADGLPIISYTDYTNRDLKVAHCTNVQCSSAELATIDSTGIVGQCGSITIGADGLPIISYADYTNVNLKVAHCDNQQCTSVTLVTIQGSGRPASYTSVTIGDDGLPIIAYSDSSTHNLKIAHCADLRCASATLATLDSTSSDNGYASVTIGSDGLPIISYYGIAADLRIAHCTDRQCSLVSRVILDNIGSTSHGYPLVTLGADGLPIISYYDGTNADLKAVHCANAFCVPYMRRR